MPVTVEPVPGDHEGLAWRTRVQYAVDEDGHAGLRAHRSHEIVRLDTCRIAHPDLPAVTSEDWYGADAVEAIVSDTGERLRIVTADGDLYLDGPKVLHERAAGRDWRVTGSGFWQVHPGAADTLVAAVLEALEPAPGERAADLYSGVGLFSAALAERVGPTGWVIGVEGDEVAVGDAARNLADLRAGGARSWTGSTGRCAAARWAERTRRGGARPAADGRQARRGRGDRRAAPRAVVPTSPATRPRSPATSRSSPSTATALTGAARVRPVPDDPPRRVRRAAHPHRRLTAVGMRREGGKSVPEIARHRVS